MVVYTLYDNSPDTESEDSLPSAGIKDSTQFDVEYNELVGQWSE